jgi:hypothetical protein
MNRYLVVAGSLLITACAAFNPQPRQAQFSANDVVCRRETPTGSRIPVRVCRSRAEMEQRRTEDRNLLKEIRSEANRQMIQ